MTLPDWTFSMVDSDKLDLAALDRLVSSGKYQFRHWETSAKTLTLAWGWT